MAPEIVGIVLSKVNLWTKENRVLTARNIFHILLLQFPDIWLVATNKQLVLHSRVDYSANILSPFCDVTFLLGHASTSTLL
jgi:hypothetical protein